MVNALFLSSFKLDRIEQLAKHLHPYDIRLNINDITNHRNLSSVLSDIRKEPKDTILITHDSMMVPFCFLLAKMFGYRYILIQNSVNWHKWNADFGQRTWKTNVRHKLFGSILDKASWVICNSHYLREQIVQYRPTITDQVVGIHNAVEPPEASVNTFPYDQNRTNFVTITNFEHPQKYKGLLPLLRSINYASIQKPTLHVLSKIIKPFGESNLAKFQQEIQHQAGSIDVQFHINKNVNSFLIPDVPLLYCSLPGGDSFPRAIVEALTLGVPSLIVETNGCAEAAFTPDTALTVPLDEHAMAEKINQLASSEELRSRLSNTAPLQIKKNLTWEQMAKQYAVLLLKC